MEKNIYVKIQNVKEKLLKENIKKSGKNKFAGYTYYELGDFTPHIVKFCNEEKLFTKFSFDKELAILTIVNTEKPSEFEVYTSPIEELELKGANKIQALGGVETYSRRYLYMAAFDIIENDMFDEADRNIIQKREKIQQLFIKTSKHCGGNDKLYKNLGKTKDEVKAIFDSADIEVLDKFEIELSIVMAND